MSTQDPREEYEARMHRVLEYIDAHLAEPLDLNVLAGVAHFSPYHFHRLFAAWMGETLGDFVRRRRLERAAAKLVTQPRLGVLDAALSVGFGSVEAFSRAFKARFGASPTAWRAQQGSANADSNGGQADSNPDQLKRNGGQAAAGACADHRVSTRSLQETSMKVQSKVPADVRLIDRQPVRVAYLRYVGPYGAPLLSFWGDVVYPWMLTNGLVGRTRYGISLDDPGITAPDKCRYDACVEVPPDTVLTGQAQRTTIAGGRYAAMKFFGSTTDIQAAWNALLRDWIPQSGLQLDDRPCFEYYPPDGEYDEKTGRFSCDLCIPVAPL